MKSVTLNGVNLQATHNLIYQTHEIESATPRTYYVSVPFSDGDLDLTESITGEPTFNNRNGWVSVGLMLGKGNKNNIRDILRRDFLGRAITLSFSDETAVYKGRCIDIEFSDKIGYYLVTFRFNLEPFRYKPTLTTYTYALSSTAAIKYISNIGKPVTPTFIATGNTTIVHNSNTYSISAGTYTLPIKLITGSNTLRVSGTGTLTVRYQERYL